MKVFLFGYVHADWNSKGNSSVLCVPLCPRSREADLMRGRCDEPREPHENEPQRGARQNATPEAIIVSYVVAVIYRLVES